MSGRKVENIVGTRTSLSLYRLHEVLTGNDICTVDILTEPLPPKTQDDMAKSSNNSLSNGGFGYFSLPHHKDIAHFVGLNKNDKQFDDIRKFLTKMYDKFYLQTSTRVDYMPDGKDIITHNYGLVNPSLPDWYKPKILEANFVGPNEFVIQTKTPEKYKPLFDMKSENIQDIFEKIQEINEDLKFLNQYEKNAYLWRLNLTPGSKNTKVVRLDAYPYGFRVGCRWDPEDSGSAFGGRIFPEGEASKK